MKTAALLRQLAQQIVGGDLTAAGLFGSLRAGAMAARTAGADVPERMIDLLAELSRIELPADALALALLTAADQRETRARRPRAINWSTT